MQLVMLIVTHFPSLYVNQQKPLLNHFAWDMIVVLAIPFYPEYDSYHNSSLFSFYLGCGSDYSWTLGRSFAISR